jgi:hypothetical protein
MIRDSNVLLQLSREPLFLGSRVILPHGFGSMRVFMLGFILVNLQGLSILNLFRKGLNNV